MTAPSHTSVVRLYFKANGLRDADVLSKSDPYCVVNCITERTDNATSPSIQSDGSGRACLSHYIGRTETIQNNLCPQWATSFEVPFHFEAKQIISVSLFDDDGKGPNGDDRLGAVEFPLSAVVCAINMSKTFPLQPKGTLTVSAMEMTSGSQDFVTIRFRGHNMKKMDTFSESDCYFHLRRLISGGQAQDLYKSEVKDDDPNPVWKPIGFPLSELTGSNHDEETLGFYCWDENVTQDAPMGSFRFSFDDLMQKFKTKTSFRLHGDKINENGERPFYGEIYVDHLVIDQKPTLAECSQ